MSTYRELIYIVLDELKSISDDSIIQQEHVIFLLDKYRTFVLKQKYSDIKKEIPDSNYQTICVDLTKEEAFEGDPCGGYYLESVQKIPDLLTLSAPKVTTLDFFSGNITYVNKERFKYVGGNKYLKNIIYSTISPSQHLYLKSTNPQYLHLNKVRITGIFEDSSKASELSCDSSDENCDLLDRTFPLEEALIPVMLQYIIKELGGVNYRPADKLNNANDDLSTMMNFIRNNMKNDFQKEISE